MNSSSRCLLSTCGMLWPKEFEYKRKPWRALSVEGETVPGAAHAPLSSKDMELWAGADVKCAPWAFPCLWGALWLVSLLEPGRFCPRGETKPPVLIRHGTFIHTELSWFLSQTQHPQDGIPSLWPWGRRQSRWPEDPDRYCCLQASSVPDSLLPWAHPAPPLAPSFLCLGSDLVSHCLGGSDTIYSENPDWKSDSL